MRKLMSGGVLAAALLAMAALVWAQNVQITQGPRIESVTENSAIVAWSTNVNASTVVKFGTDQNNLNQTAEAPWGGLTHRATLKNLQPGTTYYFDVESGQAQGSGTSTLSQVQSFTTKGTNPNPQAAPQSNPQSSNDNSSSQNWNYDLTASCQNITANSFDVVWTTNQPGSSKVVYGLDANNMGSYKLAPWGQSNHKVTVDNLSPGRTYYVQAQTEGEQGTGAKEASKQISCTTKNQ